MADALPDSPDVTLVVTTFRETSVLAGSLPRIAEALRALHRPVEIVFVDDGSGDDTPTWVERQFASIADLSPRLLRHPRNRGRGAALRTGFESARGLYTGYLDLDLEVDVAYVGDALRLLDGGADVVVGVRTYERTRSGFDVRTFLSRGYKHLSRAVLHHRLHDTETGFKFFRREALARVLPQMRDAGWFFDTEAMMVSWLAGLRIAELPVVFRRRHDKVSTVRIARDIRRYLASLARFVRRRPTLVRALRSGR